MGNAMKEFNILFAAAGRRVIGGTAGAAARIAAALLAARGTIVAVEAARAAR